MCLGVTSRRGRNRNEIASKLLSVVVGTAIQDNELVVGQYHGRPGHTVQCRVSDVRGRAGPQIAACGKVSAYEVTDAV